MCFFGNILFKYGGRPVVLILYSIQRCLNHRLNLSDSSPSWLYSLVCGVPRVAPVMPGTALYRALFILLQNESLFGWSYIKSP